MKKIECGTGREFTACVADCVTRGWRIVSMARGRGNAMWELTVDDRMPASRGSEQLELPHQGSENA